MHARAHRCSVNINKDWQMGNYMDAAEFNNYNGEEMEECIQGQFSGKISSDWWSLYSQFVLRSGR